MAGDWIKLEHITPDKPEVHQMAEILKIDSDSVVGKLIRLWIWADQQSIAGNSLKVTNSFLDRITSCHGFSDALRNVGWLKDRSDGLYLPNFDRHNGKTAKARALDSKRKKLDREGDSEKCPDENRTETGPEKRREEKNNKKAFCFEDLVFPESLNTQSFVSLFKDWVTFRMKQGKPKDWKSLFQGYLNECSQWGLEGAVSSIQYSMLHQYQGLFPPRGFRKNKPQSKMPSSADLQQSI